MVSLEAGLVADSVLVSPANCVTAAVAGLICFVDCSCARSKKKRDRMLCQELIFRFRVVFAECLQSKGRL